jgi:hypothetical protein
MLGVSIFALLDQASARKLLRAPNYSPHKRVGVVTATA